MRKLLFWVVSVAIIWALMQGAANTTADRHMSVKMEKQLGTLAYWKLLQEQTRR